MLPSVFLDRPICHRGLHGDNAPENSRAAIRAAIAAGYGIEIDIQPSSDGRAMVFHDYMLTRLTGESGVIRTHSAQDLNQIKLLGSDEFIPTLPEILAIVDGQAPLIIEIKDQDGAMGPNLIGVEETVAAHVADYKGDLALMSFNAHSVKALKANCPTRPVGLVTCPFWEELWPHIPAARREELAKLPDFESCGADFISHDIRDLNTNTRVAEIKRAGVPVLCWTVRSPEEEAKARLVADNITFENYMA